MAAPEVVVHELTAIPAAVDPAALQAISHRRTSYAGRALGT